MATVLVVDDAGGKTHALTRELTQLGYRVVSAVAGGAGGMEPVTVAEVWRPDVVLLDIAMAQMDAIEACRRLRAVPVLQSTPIILVSSKEEEPRLVSGLEAGAFDCITRPFSPTVLSARVRSAVRMKRAQETLQATARLRSELLQTASDELRTPVAAILNVTDNLLEPDRSEEERRRAINSVRQSGDHLLQIVNDISDVSRMEAGKLEVDLADCSPVEIVSEVVTLLRPQADAKGIVLDVDYPEGAPTRIRSDPVRLRRILVNLVGNAVRSAATGRVYIRAACWRAGAGNGSLQLEISAGGLGACADGKGTFRPYSGIDPSVLREWGATGLALAVSNRLTELLGGEMSVACMVHKRCVVRVSVPISPPDEARFVNHALATADGIPAVGRQAAAGVRLGGRRILVAENDPSLQESLSHILANAGAMVTVAVNGPAAASLALAVDAAGRSFDAIVIGMHLAALDGGPAVGILRKRGYCGPILGLTNDASPAEHERCLDAGCNDVVVKPVDTTAFLVAVSSALGDEVSLKPAAVHQAEGVRG